jgi:hypothetical protein
MSQISAGTVAVTNNNATVTGTGVDWSGVTTACLFATAAASNTLYSITDVSQRAANPPRLTLGAPYAGLTDAVAAYAIHKDFTPRFALPLIDAGDIATRPLLRDMAVICDTNLGGGGGGGGAVASVFGRTGAVTAQSGDYTMALIADTGTYVRMLATERTKLAGIADGAQVNPPLATQAEAEAGTENTHTMTALRVSQAIAALGGGGGGAGPGGYVPLDAMDISATTDAPASGTWRRYINASGCAITLDGTLGIEGECVLAKGSGSGTLTLTAGSGFTLNGGSATPQLVGLAVVKRVSTDFVISGGTDEAKSLYGTQIMVGDLKTQKVVPAVVTISSLPDTIGATHNGKIVKVTGAGTLSVPAAATLCPLAGDGFACLVKATAAITIDGPGGTNPTMASGDIAAIIAENGGTISFVKQAATTIS